MTSLNIIFGLFLGFFVQAITSDDAGILGCGGFVKSDVSIDFSKVEIQLFTKEGMLKYQTECAPNNGYYMVPFVEKGDFVLKVAPPKGWLFDPMSIPLVVDGVNDDCTKGKDINFLFKGFTLSGQVSSLGGSKGPEGVTLELKTEGKTVTKTVSHTSGSFEFNGIPTGNYEVMASHESYTFKNDRVKVAVTNTNAQCRESLVVSGYDVHGHVSAHSLPVAGVHLLLFSKVDLSANRVTGCSTARPANSNDVKSSEYPHFICLATSADDGKYHFPSLPPSQYLIVPFHRGERIQFDVEPQSLKFSVENSRINQQAGFKVTGFSVEGRVLNSKDGQPVQGAEIFIDNKLQDTTDKKGYYTLKHMHSGMYNVVVKKHDMEFPMTQTRVGPDTPILPNIVADKFSLCGVVNIIESPSSTFKINKVEIELVDSKSVSLKINLNEKGGFCFMVQPGKYIIKPVLSKYMKESGLVLNPESSEIVVSNAPVKSISFQQFRASFKVGLTCIHLCNDVALELVSSQPGRKALKQKISSKGNATSTVFSDVLPGEYQIKVSHNDWCWESENIKVNVEGKQGDSTPPLAQFKQSGFVLVCSISHDIEMVIHHAGEMVDMFSLKKGRNRLCLSLLGEYQLEPRSCHKFDADIPLTYNTAHPKPISLHAVAHEAVITMVTGREFKAEESGVEVMIKTSKGKVSKELLKPSDKKSEGNQVLYTLSYWAGDGERLEIQPASKALLFQPPTSAVTMHAAECSSEIVRFKGIIGKFINGQITPPIPNIDITIETVGEDDLLELKTDEKGSYSVGPLYPDKEYKITASMEDYVMSPVSGHEGHFLAKKLSKLMFNINLEEDNSPLPGVLLSISGGNYRSNNLTGNDGMLTLSKLEPGQYYFKAMMKEYEFIPPSQVIEIVEGQKTDINIVGRRVSFSVFGSVMSLNGEPESNIWVRTLARTGTDDQCRGLGEEVASSNDGSFRLRGLHPGCLYDITVRDADNLFDRVEPPRVELLASEHDVHDVRFVAFRPLGGFELSGRVIADQEFLPFIKVALYQSSESTSAIHVLSLTKATPFFYFPSIPRDEKEYVVKLESTLATSMYDYTTPAAGFFATGPQKHVTFRFEPQMKAIDHETPQASLFALPFTLIVIFLAYNYQLVLSYLQQLIQSFGKKEPENIPRNSRKYKK